MSGTEEFFQKYQLVRNGMLGKEKKEDFFSTRVQMALNKTTGEEVVVKYNRFFQGEENANRYNRMSGLNVMINLLRQEPAALKAARGHRGIVNMLDYYEDFFTNKEMFIVMEKVTGTSLWDFINSKGPMGSKNIYIFMYFLIDAINYIHNKGLIHRDINPNNIFVQFDEDRQLITGVKVIDFGLVYMKGFGVKTGFGLTAGYAPPESVGRLSKLVERAHDIYSAGAVIYYVLTGSLPYDVPVMTSKQDEKFYKDINREDISPVIVDFIRKCVRFNPKDRPNSIIEIKSTVYKELKLGGLKIE